MMQLVHLTVQSPSNFLINYAVKNAVACVIAEDHMHCVLSKKQWCRLFRYVKGRFAFRVKKVQSHLHLLNILRYYKKHGGVVYMSEREDVLKQVLERLERIEKRIDAIESASKQANKGANNAVQTTEVKTNYATFTVQYNANSGLVWLTMRKGRNSISTGLNNDELNALIDALRKFAKKRNRKSKGRKIEKKEGFEKAVQE